MEKKDRRCAAVIVTAAAVLLLGAVLLTPPLFQLGYDPVSPGPVSGAQLVRVDLNRAGEAALRNLPGIGEGKAKAIIEYRTLHGSFEKIEDIILVQGISEQDLEALRPYLYIQ